MKKITLIIILFFIKANLFPQWIVQDVSSLTSSNFKPVYFSNNLNGWVGGTAGTIIHTSNAGNNWGLQNTGVNSFISDIYFLDSLNGWAVTNSNQILKTNNSGINWTVQSLLGNFSFVHFTDTLNGFTANLNGIIYKTDDGGQNWDTISESIPVQYTHDVFVLDSSHAWGVSSGYIHRFDGNNWTQTYFNGGHDFYSVHFIDSLRGWAVGAYGLIMNTIDGGYTWNDQSTSWTNGYLVSVFFIDSINGWAVGDLGKVLKYDGVNWIDQNSNINQMLSDVHFSDINHGWATSWGGKLIHIDIGANIYDNVKNDTFNFSIYPNPTSSQITIDTELQINEVSIIDVIGKMIMTAKQNTNVINVADLSNGIYFIKLITNEKTITKKFVKQ